MLRYRSIQGVKQSSTARSSGRFSFVSPKSPESQSQAKPSLNGIHKGGRKRHFRYERPTSRIRCISARAPEERLIGRHNPRGKAHFAGAVGKNTVRADCVVEGAVCCEPV